MRGQPNRLAAATAGPLAGSVVDRGRPLAFRLDGRTIAGFAGDSVLSAALAAGIDTVGRRGREPLALSSRFSPAIIAADQVDRPHQALAMARTPATEGADYLTLPTGGVPAWRAGLRRWTRPRDTLGLTLSDQAVLVRPWMESLGVSETPADLIVVGGGVAGMEAALAGAKAGLSVVLLEASPRLGGSARLFGTLEGEETADASLLRLGAALAGSGGITTFTNAAVFAMRAGAVRVHLTDTSAGQPEGRVVELRARYIVLATGSNERLPVFAGNRLPGTVGVREAWELAEHYGVWCGPSALLATASNAAYRLAMLARDAGIAVPAILDSRPQPQSRFIEFSKAYGIPLVPGTIITAAQRGPQGRGLAISAQLRVDRFSRDEPVVLADRLVICGGWQPALDLWHMAGGASGWDETRQALLPLQGPDGVALAGNAAGHSGHQACLASGAAAVDRLLGRPPARVTELEIEAIYETPDGATPLAENGPASFLDGGRSAVARPVAQTPRRIDRLLRRWPQPARPLADGPLALGVGDIAAGVQLGAIAPEHAGLVARQRLAMVAMAAAPAQDTGKLLADAPLVPAFLAGRFGSDAALWLIAPLEARVIEPGALLQANGDITDPIAAIGVVLRAIEGGVLVLLAADQAQVGKVLAVREPGRATAVRLLGPYSLPIA